MKPVYFYYFFIINILLPKISLSQGDNCYSALTLTNVTNYCSNTAIYTNVGSTVSGLAVATCWTGASTSDVWFSFTATGTDILISVNGSGFGGTMVRPRIALYFGTCTTSSTSVNQLGCNNGTAGSGFSQLYVGGLILGNTYLIRISSTTANTGTFELCVNNYVQPPFAGADCGGASHLCNKNSLSVGGLNGGGLNANEPSNETNSCMTGSIFSNAETNSAWYTWTCGTSGPLLFDLIPSDPTNDIDYVLYQLSSTNPCGTRTIIRCNTTSCLNAIGSTGLNATDTDISEASGCAPGQNAYCQQLNMVAGTSYAILINNADGTSGFTINWGGTGTFLGPNPIIVASDTTICVGETVIFNGNTSTNSVSYNWTFNGNGAPSNIIGAGPHSVSYPTAGSYVAILQTTSALGCNSTKFKNILVTASPSLSVNSGSICAGNSLTLAANGAANYTWSPATNLSSTTGSVVVANPNTTTVYSVIGANGSCTATANSTVNVTTTPTVAVNSGSICAGSSLTLTANGAANYTWSPTTNLSSSTGSVVVANPNSTTIYSVIGANGSCAATANSTVNVTTNPTVAVNSGSICAGNSLTLTANGAANYTWSPGTNLSSTTGSVVVASPNTTTVYSIIGANGSCTATANSTVNVTTTPTVTVNSGSICAGSSLTLTANGAANYTWSPTTNLSSSTGSVVVANPNSTTVYSVIGANGSCTATANSTVNVTSNPTLTVNSGSICSGSSITLTANGASSYTWSPATNLSLITGSVVVADPNTTTVYLIIGANGNCTATANSTVNIIASPTITVNSSTICTGQQTATLTANGAITYSWIPSANLSASTGSLVTGTPASSENYTVAGTDGNGCISIETATIIVNPLPALTISPNLTVCPLAATTITAGGAATYTWSPNIFLNNNNTSTVISTPSITTTYTVDGLSPAACFNSTVMTIAVVNSLVVNASAITPTICPLGSTSLNASGATSYTWSPSLTLSSPNGSIVIGSPQTSTTYTVIGATSTCTNSAEVVVTLTINPIIAVVCSPSIICSGSLSALTANGALTYTWSPNTTLSSANGSNVNANPNITTIYTISGTNAFGCIGSVNTTLTVISTPTISAIANPVNICIGQTSNLSALGASNYTWSPAINISNINNSSTSATPSITTVYSVSGSIGNSTLLCTSSNTVQVNVIPAPTITVNPQVVICEGQLATIYAAGGTSYTWSPTTGLTNPFDALTNINPIGSGTFIYTVTALSNNCVATETVEVIVNPLPIINAGSDTTINNDNTLVLFGTGNTEVGFLSPDGVPLSCNYCYSLTVNPQNNICYTLEGINNFGCRATDDICVTVTKDWDVFIPNAFTPNGDKFNELFIPVGYGIDKIQLIIFDRWGHQVFKSNGDNIGWDGKKKGQLCEQGVYVYQAEITAMSGAKLSKTGHVTLLLKVK